MPKILYLVTEDWFFASHFLTMARAARQLGLDVAVATRVTEHGDRLSSEGFRIIALESDRKSLRLSDGVRYLVRTGRIIRSERPDIVHCIALRPVVLGGTAAKLARVKGLVLAPTGLGHVWTESGPLYRLVRSFVRVVVGSRLRGPRTRYLFENTDDPHEFGLDSEDADVTIVGGCGVDANAFPFVPQPPAPPVKIAVVARMLKSKGIAEAVAAVECARSLGAPLELSLFGEPDPRNPNSLTESALRRWSTAPGIHWYGHVSDVSQVWQQHHIALLLSYREGLPRALVEAAAAGRPIVATDVVGCREVVRNGKEGLLVPLGDIEAAARALVKLAGDACLREHMGRAANMRFHEAFTADGVIRAIGGLYRSLADP
jgi:glycosyltransferase involved in cell wall biosynthesis